MWPITRPVRLWPLIFSALALWPLLYLVPVLYSDIRFSLGGAHTIGWYSDFGPYYGTNGKPYFLYAYKVGTATYGGQGLFDDSTSEVYFRKPGDPMGVTYLAKKPWLSTMRWPTWELKQSAMIATIPFLVFVGGLYLSMRPHRKDASAVAFRAG
jgi:hypothetical protein